MYIAGELLCIFSENSTAGGHAMQICGANNVLFIQTSYRMTNDEYNYLVCVSVIIIVADRMIYKVFFNNVYGSRFCSCGELIKLPPQPACIIQQFDIVVQQ